MRRHRLLVAVTLLFALQAAALPGDLEAHPSRYCGHKSDGITITTRFERQWGGPHGQHWHEYSHRRWDAWEIHERVAKLCPH